MNLNNKYMNAKELHDLTKMSIEECRKIIKQARKLMKERKQYVPSTRPMLAKVETVNEILR